MTLGGVDFPNWAGLGFFLSSETNGGRPGGHVAHLRLERRVTCQSVP
jgi:hypothetical protein